MKIFIYNFREDEKQFYDKFCEKYDVEIGKCSDYPSMENAELTRGYEGVSILVSDMNEKILQKFHDMGVKYITTRSVGFDHFDMNKVRELGLRVSTVAYSPQTVANYAIMLMLMCCRKAKYIMQTSAINEFSLAGKRGIEISGKTIGIIGTGKIGTTVLKHLSGFGCKLIAYDVYESEEAKKYAEYVDFDTLLKTSDIVSFHAPSLPENYHMLNDETVKKMKDGVIIINTARGGLVDSQAIINGVVSGKIGAAGLDVIESEFGLYYLNLTSQIVDNKELTMLRSFPNVIVTPHTAFYTDESISDMIENAIKGCCLFAEGKENPLEVK